jgi:sec-independent protein translocase protein TatA
MSSFPPAFAFIGPPEIIVILLIVLLFFGAKRLPELAKGMGKAVSEFRKASSAAEEEIKTAIDQEPRHRTAHAPAPAQPAQPPPAADKPGAN